MTDTIGQKIMKIRQAKSMTPIEFSLSIGISQGRLSEIEKDITKPSADTIIALRRQFDVDLNSLLGN